MRHWKIFILNFERVLEYRGTIFVWFLISLFHPLLYLLFWVQVLPNIPSVGVFSIQTYYLLFIIAGGFLFIHVESDSNEDIRQGGLSAFLLKPLSYFWFKFYSELPWRLIQGFFGVISIVSLVQFFGVSLALHFNFTSITIALCTWILGYFLMFYFKMFILLSALWFTDTGGLKQLTEVIVLILCGFIVPISFFPQWLKTVALFSPFPYMIYFPVLSLMQGHEMTEWIKVLIFQLGWLCIFIGLYGYMWKKGIRTYTALGQ
jgi:ABC-2 type transport system permease protein